MVGLISVQNCVWCIEYHHSWLEWQWGHVANFSGFNIPLYLYLIEVTDFAVPYTKLAIGMPYTPPPNAWYLTLHFQGRTHKLVEGCLYFPSILPFPSILLLSPSFPFSSSPCPTPFLLFRSPPLPLEVGPLKPSGGLGSAVSSPRPQTNWMHSRSVRKPPVAIILSILKCMFYSRSIKIWHKLS